MDILYFLGLLITLFHLSHSASDGSFPKSACISMVPTYRRQTSPQPNTDVNEYGFAGPVSLNLEFGDRYSSKTNIIYWTWSFITSIYILSNIYSTPFILIRDKNVTIYTKDPSDRFIGFMLQVRYEAERYDSSIEKGPIGEFTVNQDDPFKCMDCNNKCDR